MGSGSTILARQSGWIYVPVIIAIGIAIIAVIIFLLLKQISSYKKTPAYIEKQKNRATNYADVKKFCIRFNLTADEKALLWEICQECHPKNINYIVNESQELDSLFREEYTHFRERRVAEKKIADFFQLRYKLEKTMAQTKNISSTINIPVGAIIFYVDQNGEQFPLTVQQNTKSFLSLEIPAFLVTSGRKPEELKKARFMYKTANGMTYLFVSRPIRYSQMEDRYSMVAAHSNNLILQTQRQTKREFVKSDCRFASVKADQSKKPPVYIHSERKYPAKLINVSAGGCCIHTKLPIKEGQFISIYFPELDMNENTIGVIKHTRVVPTTGNYALHIQFTNISLKVQNRIYAFVYKFEL